MEAVSETPQAYYYPDVFLRNTIAEARSAILTPEAGLTTDERWARETQWIADRIHLPEGLALDIGCGIGRISKILVARHHSVLGVDISPSMRQMAECEISNAGNFSAISPGFLWQLVQNGLRVNSAIAIWVLQHVPSKQLDLLVETLAEAMPSRTPLWTMERDARLLPAMAGERFVWGTDDSNTEAVLSQYFAKEMDEPVPAELCTPGASLCRWVRK